MRFLSQSGPSSFFLSFLGKNFPFPFSQGAETVLGFCVVLPRVSAVPPFFGTSSAKLFSLSQNAFFSFAFPF